MRVNSRKAAALSHAVSSPDLRLRWLTGVVDIRGAGFDL